VAIIKDQNFMIKLIIPLFLFISCSGQNKEVVNYYFPIKDFFVSKTYCFVNKNDTTEKSFWKMETSVSNNDTLLKTSIFDSKQRIIEMMVENVKNGNSKIHNYTIYQYDRYGNENSFTCNVIDSSVFLASQMINQAIQWKVLFDSYNSIYNCEMSKVRTLTNTSSNQATFSDLMRIKMFDTNQEYKYSMIFIYEKGKGLISYKQIFPGKIDKDFVLKAII
jgi:hypothetical protein